MLCSKQKDVKMHDEMGIVVLGSIPCILVPPRLLVGGVR